MRNLSKLLPKLAFFSFDPQPEYEESVWGGFVCVCVCRPARAIIAWKQQRHTNNSDSTRTKRNEKKTTVHRCEMNTPSTSTFFLCVVYFMLLLLLSVPEKVGVARWGLVTCGEVKSSRIAWRVCDDVRHSNTHTHTKTEWLRVLALNVFIWHCHVYSIYIYIHDIYVLFAIECLFCVCVRVCVRARGCVCGLFAHFCVQLAARSTPLQGERGWDSRASALMKGIVWRPPTFVTNARIWYYFFLLGILALEGRGRDKRMHARTSARCG